VGGPAACRLPGVRLGLELDLLPLTQFIEGRLLNHAAVEEHLFGGTVRLDEAKPPVTDDSGDFACSHVELSLPDAAPAAERFGGVRRTFAER